jgi:hypothetical protein
MLGWLVGTPKCCRLYWGYNYFCHCSTIMIVLIFNTALKLKKLSELLFTKGICSYKINIS